MYKVTLTAEALRDAEVDIHREHGVVYGLFDGRPDRVLYRRDGRVVLIASDTPPSGRLARSVVEVDAPSINEGDRVQGVLRASPTVSVPVPGQRGKVRPIKNTDDVRLWFARKLSAAGLTIEFMGVAIEKPAIGHKPGGRRIVHNRAEARFVATVVDGAALCDAVSKGVGRGKAYGHGLLLVAPCPS